MNLHRGTLLLVTGVVVAFAAPLSPAAMIVGTVDPNPADNSADLTALGTLDWALWNTTSSPYTPAIPTNEKTGGTLIGNIVALGGGNTRGSSAAAKPETFFSYSDGTPAYPGAPFRVSGLFNSQLGPTGLTAGAGVAVTVDLPTLDTYRVYVWAANFKSTGTLTASLPGAIDYVDSSIVAGDGSVKDTGLYTFTVTPDTAGDDFTVKYVMTGQTDANAHVVLAAVAVQAEPVPEPSAMVLAAVALAGLCTLGCRKAARSVRRA